MTKKSIAVALGTVGIMFVLMLAGGEAARGQCLPQSECAALKEQLKTFRDQVKPIRQEARELRRELRQLERGSAEWRQARRALHELRHELRRLGASSEIRRVVRAYRAGCRDC